MGDASAMGNASAIGNMLRRWVSSLAAN
jgi:hypothetical protein